MKVNDELINIVSQAAPILGSVLGSPIAGFGIGLLAHYFNVSQDDTNKLLETIKNDPEATLKIKTLEYQHQETLSKVASVDYQTEVDDRKSARQREISLHDYVPTILAVGFLINYALIQFYCVTHNNPVNDIISARFQDVLIMIISYYFGSSHKEKPKQ